MKTAKPQAEEGEAKMFPIMSCYSHRLGAYLPRLDMPWEMIAPHEEQAKANHCGQNLDRLASRGGLSPDEVIAVLDDMPWREIDIAQAHEAVKDRVVQFLAEEKSEPTTSPMKEIVKFASSEDEVAQIVTAWHKNELPHKELYEALGWTFSQYADWVETCKIPENVIAEITIDGVVYVPKSEINKFREALVPFAQIGDVVNDSDYTIWTRTVSAGDVRRARSLIIRDYSKNEE